MKAYEIIQALNKHTYDQQIKKCTCNEDVTPEIDRYTSLLTQAVLNFGEGEYHLFSAPGRTEVGGNHTDHQQGRVLAAAVNMDTTCAVKKNDNSSVSFISEGFKINPISLTDLSIKEEEIYTSESLIRGILFRFQQLGYKIGGFSAYSNSTVLKGSGISSSACFETLIGTILSSLYNNDQVSAVEIAKIGQYAENVYFGKPCGLMDQVACSVGGFVAIDFKEKQRPIVEKVEFDFLKSGYALCLVDTKGDHADLSEEYGTMPNEMKQVANVLGKEVLSQCTLQDLLENIVKVRETCHDRAILRAIHFFNETDRVVEEVNALKNNDLKKFLKTVVQSGNSSYMYLQNVYSTSDPYHQNLSLALAVSQQILRGKGAYRVHGGGLAGTIQAFVPQELLSEYQSVMNKIYGDGSCFILSIRPVGGFRIC